MKEETLYLAVKKSIVDSADSLAGGVDLLVSIVTDSAVLENLPLVSTGLKILKARDSFREHIYVRNCYALLEACKGTDRDCRERLWQKLEKDPNKADDFIDTVFLIATESSKPIKATIAGRLIAALCNERIEYEQYDAMVHLVHSASIAAIKAIPQYFERSQGKVVYRNAIIPEEPLLFSCGIGFRFGKSFRVSELGELVYKIGFEGKIIPEEI